MATIYSNYRALSLTAGTYSTYDLGDGMSASTIHRVFCLTPGIVNITPFEGSSFDWSASTINNYIDVVIKGLTISGGTFIGFGAKNSNPTRNGSSYPY